MAVDIDLKFATLQNPEECSLEELKAQVDILEAKVGFYETKQLAIKKFINSVYGALGSKYFQFYNVYMAESITAQGRDLNHFTEMSINEYFEGTFQSNPEIEVYYQWQHTDAEGRHWTFKNDDKPDDYYLSGKWVECKKWEPAVKKGKKVTPDIKDAYNDNSVHKCDWLVIKTDLWSKLCLIPEKCKSYNITIGDTRGPLVGPEFDYLNSQGKQHSLAVGGDTDSVYVSGFQVVNYCAPHSIYWGVSKETQDEVFKLCGKFPEKRKDIPNEELRNKVFMERRNFQTQVIVDLWDYSLGPYMEKKFDYYAQKYNCDKNLQGLELEKIASTVLYFAKKMYVMSECWKEPNIFLPYMEHVLNKGVPIVRGSTPSYVRECMSDFCEFVLRWYEENDEIIPYEALIDKLKEYKRIFMIKSPEEICTGTSISNYEKFIADDKNSVVLNDKTPIFVKGAAIYNFFLNQEKNKKYRMKYQPLGSADKVKWYYTTDNNYDVFAYSPGQFPAEFALPIDRELQFEKTLLTFCNKVIEITGHKPVNSTLCYTTALF